MHPFVFREPESGQTTGRRDGQVPFRERNQSVRSAPSLSFGGTAEDGCPHIVFILSVQDETPTADLSGMGDWLRIRRTLS